MDTPNLASQLESICAAVKQDHNDMEHMFALLAAKDKQLAAKDAIIKSQTAVIRNLEQKLLVS
jgi:hypothetical protein